MKLQEIDRMILQMITRGCSNEFIKSELNVTEARIKLIRFKRAMGEV